MRKTKQMVLISLLITVMGCCHGKPDEQKEVATKFVAPDIKYLMSSFENAGKNRDVLVELVRDIIRRQPGCSSNSCNVLDIPIEQYSALSNYLEGVWKIRKVEVVLGETRRVEIIMANCSVAAWVFEDDVVTSDFGATSSFTTNLPWGKAIWFAYEERLYYIEPDKYYDYVRDDKKNLEVCPQN